MLSLPWSHQKSLINSRFLRPEWRGQLHRRLIQKTWKVWIASPCCRVRGLVVGRSSMAVVSSWLALLMRARVIKLFTWDAWPSFEDDLTASWVASTAAFKSSIDSGKSCSHSGTGKFSLARNSNAAPRLFRKPNHGETNFNAFWIASIASHNWTIEESNWPSK